METRLLAETIYSAVVHGQGTKRHTIDKIASMLEADRTAFETVREALVLAGEIKQKIEVIERCEEWTDGEPTLGTCRTFGQIKQIASQCREAIAALARLAGKEE